MAGIKQDVVVLSVNQYEVTDRQTGEVNQGCTVRYALADNLLPSAEGNLKGYKLAKANLDYKLFDSFGNVPGVYSTDLSFNISSDGTTKISASNFLFKRDLFTVKESK